jgi:hypothetical protein
MPDSVDRSLLEDWLRQVARLSAKYSKEPSLGKKVAGYATRYDLDCDETGTPQYMIAMDIGGRRHNYKSVKMPVKMSGVDPQSAAIATPRIPDDLETNDANEATPEDIIARIRAATGTSKASLICDVETFTFDARQREDVSAILWDYITTHRDSTNREILVAVGSAIRKHVAMLDVNRLEEIAPFLEAGHRAALPLSLELEIAKMIYRKFEANPPPQPDSQPLLMMRLMEMAQTYAAPRLILREKYATVAALSIAAIVSLRSSAAGDAIQVAIGSPFTFLALRQSR